MSWLLLLHFFYFSRPSCLCDAFNPSCFTCPFPFFLRGCFSSERPFSYYYEEAGHELFLKTESLHEWTEIGSCGHAIFPPGFFHRDALLSMIEGERSRFLFSGIYAFPDAHNDPFTGRELVPKGAAVLFDVKVVFVGSMNAVSIYLSFVPSGEDKTKRVCQPPSLISTLVVG